MKKIVKRIILALTILASLGLASYGAYTLYNYAVEDAARRIKERVAEGVAEGASRGVRNILNPFSWFSGIFKHKKKTADAKNTEKAKATTEESTQTDEESDD